MQRETENPEHIRAEREREKKEDSRGYSSEKKLHGFLLLCKCLQNRRTKV
jgi:hypothetical protein